MGRGGLLPERSVARLGAHAHEVLTLIGLLALAPVERQLVAQVLELSDEAAGQALGELVNYGLLVRLERRYEVSHPLIHTYARQVLLPQHDPASQRSLVERVVGVLYELFPEAIYANWVRCEELLPHVQAGAALIEEQRLTLTEAAELLRRTGWYLGERARYTKAEPLLQRALAI